MASAISVGVISSSPASSATALTSAIALRIRSAAARREVEPPLLSNRFARPDHNPALRLLADARARHVRVALEGKVDGSAFERLHRVEGDRVTGHLDLARGPHRYLADGVLAPLPVTLDVDDHPLALGQVLADHDVGDRLQGPQGFAAPADQAAKIASADVQGDRFGAWPHADLGADAH